MAEHGFTKSEREKMRIYQASRVVVGFCPSCQRLVVALNDHEGWPPGLCECGWGGDLTELVDRRRFESLHRRLDLPPDERRIVMGNY